MHAIKLYCIERLAHFIRFTEENILMDKAIGKILVTLMRQFPLSSPQERKTKGHANIACQM
jgi:hypothetical protein